MTWYDAYSSIRAKLGSTAGRINPCLVYHEKRKHVMVHGDVFLSGGVER